MSGISDILDLMSESDLKGCQPHKPDPEPFI